MQTTIKSGPRGSANLEAASKVAARIRAMGTDEVNQQRQHTSASRSSFLISVRRGGLPTFRKTSLTRST